MSRRPIRAGALLLGVALLAGAPATAGARSIMGAGTFDCRRWALDRQVDAYFSDVQWVLGYLTRADRDYPHGILKRLDSAAVVTWLDEYCAAHPDDHLETAALRLEANAARPPSSAHPHHRPQPHHPPPRP